MASAVIAAVAVLLGAGLSLMAYMVKTLLNTATMLEATSEKLDDIEQRNNERFARLEGVVFMPSWKDRT